MSINKLMIVIATVLFVGPTFADIEVEAPGSEQVAKAQIEAAMDELENKIIAEEESYEADKSAYLKKMVDQPVDYKALNKKLKFFSEKISEKSNLVNNVDMSINSVLTGRAHRWATFGNRTPKLPYYLPVAGAQVAVSVDFASDANLPLPINGFGINLKVGQTPLSLRGLLAVKSEGFPWNPGWTDEYSGEVVLKVDSLDLLKKLASFKKVEEFCNSEEFLLGDLEDILEDYPKVEDLVKETCGVLANADAYQNYATFIKDLQAPVKTLNDTVEKIIDDIWWKEAKSATERGVAYVLDFVSKGFYHYNIEAKSCGKVRSFLKKFKVPCEDKLAISAGGGAGVADIDGEIDMYADRLVLRAISNVSSGVREGYVADKMDLAAYGYMGLNAFMDVSYEVLDLISVEVAEELEELQKELNESVAEGTLEIL